MGDRESDIYELFCAAQELGTHFLVRTCADRLCGDGTHTVAQEMHTVRSRGVHRIEFRDKNGRVCQARLALMFRRLRLLPSRAKRSRYPELTVTVIHAREKDKPKGRDPIDELATISQRVQPLGLQTRQIRSKDLGDTKLIIENANSQVKIEVNIVFRGTVLPVEHQTLSTRTSDLIGVELEAPILARDELYAGKLVAALDRQHPRDLFDVGQLYESGGLTGGMAECFTIYRAGHNRPPHEVLFGSDKDLSAEYERAFVGMTEVTAKHKQFLGGLVRAEPDWSLLKCSHARELPALRWKVTNLEAFRKRRPADFSAQADALLAGLGLA